MTSETIVGSRIRSGGLSLDSKRGVEVMRFANWSWLIFQVTFGNCLVNSSDELERAGRSRSRSTAFSSTGSVPQVGPAAAALADGAAALGGAALAARRLPAVVVAAGDG